MKLAANLSVLFTECDFLDRFEAAQKAGFKGVECQFPYEYDADELAEKLKSHNLTQVLFNLPPGNWSKGERGIACLSGREEEFRVGVSKAIGYAKRLDCKQLNCLSGVIPEGVSFEEAEKTLIQNLKYAADKLEAEGIKLLIEAINTRDIPGFFLNTTKQALGIIEQVGSDNLALQYDIYHMQIMEGDLAPTIEANLAMIDHIQLADTPGRHEPGSGEINFNFLLQYIDRKGYDGWIGCEYNPAMTTEAGLGWMKDF